MTKLGTCSKCGQENISIVMHHTDYENDITIPICRSCHKTLHNELRKKGTPLHPPDFVYVNISLPRSLVNEITTSAVGKRGYTGVTEFVKDACRRHLDSNIPSKESGE